jgi:hypothetical protein
MVLVPPLEMPKHFCVRGEGVQHQHDNDLLLLLMLSIVI